MGLLDLRIVLQILVMAHLVDVLLKSKHLYKGIYLHSASGLVTCRIVEVSISKLLLFHLLSGRFCFRKNSICVGGSLPDLEWYALLLCEYEEEEEFPFI